jgi:hypothetical protein
MIVAWAALFCLLAAHAQLAPPPAGLKPAQLALVINDDEPNSVEIGEYYRQTRNVPAENVVHVRIPDRPRKLDAEQFRQIKEQIDAKLGRISRPC